MSFTQEQLDAAKREAAEEAEKKSQAQFAAKDAELLLLRGQRQTERIAAQVSGWVATGKVLPAEQAGLAEFMASLENGTAGEFTFSAADKTEVKKTPVQFFADFMAGRKPLVKLGVRQMDDPAEGAVDKSSHVAIAEAANEFKAAEEKAGRIVTFEAAVSHVMTRT